MKKILLHACCAVCVLYPIEKLISMGYMPTIYFCNPNIHPETEYQRRLAELEKYCAENNFELFVEDLDHSLWNKHIEGLEFEPEKGLRCEKCFEFRLIKTAQFAIKNNFDTITTTLTVSPHKNSKTIFSVMEKVCSQFNLNYLDCNFKKENGFLKTSKKADELGFYRQTYCGCEYSIRN